MRRILFPLLIIGVVAGLFSLGSGAYFSDTETSTWQHLHGRHAGPDARTTVRIAHCDIGNLAPDVLATPNDVTFDTPTAGQGSGVTNDASGGGNHCELTVTNSGSLPGDLYLTIAVNNENETRV